MTASTFTKDFALRIDAATARLLGRLSDTFARTRFEAISKACILGMIGAGSVILAVMFALTAGTGAFASLMSSAEGHEIAMQPGPTLWGLAFLAGHIGFLRGMTDPFWRTPLGLVVFAGLSFSVSLLFVTLVLTLAGLGIVAVMVAHMMTTGFCLTVIGLALWVAWQRHLAGSIF